MYHPATEFVCRHCGENAGHDPEACFYCGPICGNCFDLPCPNRKSKEKPDLLALPSAKRQFLADEMPAVKQPSRKKHDAKLGMPLGGSPLGLSNTA